MEQESATPAEDGADSTGSTVVCAAAILVDAATSGAPFPDASPTGRRTIDGHAACELCGRQLSHIKHHRPFGVGRACSPRCKPFKLKVDGATRTHKRPSSNSPAPPAPGAPLPVAQQTPQVQPPLHQQSTWSTHAWQLHVSSRTSRAMCGSWLSLMDSGELKGWQEKRGGWFQHETEAALVCSLEEQKRVHLLSSSEAQARLLLSTLGVDSHSLMRGDVKLICMPPGKGEQEVHYDLQQYEDATRCYSVLFYLVDTEATAVPSVPVQQLRDCFTSDERLPPVKARAQIAKECFHRFRVQPGDALVFRGDVPHFGVANPDPYDRYVLFLQFYPRGMLKPDSEEQRYPHGVLLQPFPASRSKRAYGSLHSTQKWERRKQLRAEVNAAVERICCPLDAIQQPPMPSPAEVIHLPTSVREQIRSVPTLHIPSEQTIIKFSSVGSRR